MDSYLSDSEDYDPPDYDIKCESLLPIIEKTQKAFFHCHRADDICTAIRITREFSLDSVIIHATEGWKVADILAREDIPVICGPVICDRCKPEMSGLELKNAAVLDNNGVKISICTDHPVVPIQYLPMSVQACIKGGLDDEEALRAITINAAEILGIDEETGSIEIGKQADLQLYEKNEDPLGLMTEPSLVMISGAICG